MLHVYTAMNNAIFHLATWGGGGGGGDGKKQLPLGVPPVKLCSVKKTECQNTQT